MIPAKAVKLKDSLIRKEKIRYVVSCFAYFLERNENQSVRTSTSDVWIQKFLFVALTYKNLRSTLEVVVQAVS